MVPCSGPSCRPAHPEALPPPALPARRNHEFRDFEPWPFLISREKAQKAQTEFSFVCLVHFCGKILFFRRPHARFAVGGISTTGHRYKRSALERSRFGERHAGQFAGLAGQRKVLAQREIWITFPH